MLPDRSRWFHRLKSCSHACLSRTTVEALSPGQSGPNNACNASVKSLVLMPLRYSQGISSSTLLALRRYGGRILLVNRSRSSVGPAVVHARLGDRHGPDAGDDLTRRQVPVAHHLTPAAFIGQVGTGVDVLGDLGLDRLGQQLPGTTADQLR